MLLVDASNKGGVGRACSSGAPSFNIDISKKWVIIVLLFDIGLGFQERHCQTILVA